MLQDIVLNAIVDWLSPAEYDGLAVVTLPEGDKRLQLPSLLKWEAQNVIALSDKASHLLSGHLVACRDLFSAAKARDKSGRLVQYALRLLIGALCRASSPAIAQGEHIQALRQAQQKMSDARRTFRFLEFGPIVDLLNLRLQGESSLIRRLLLIVGRWAAALFSCLDRVRWLQDRRMLQGHAGTTAQRAMRCLATAHACNLIRLLHKALKMRGLGQRLRLSGSGAPANAVFAGPDGEAAPSNTMERVELLETLRDAAKQTLCLLQAAHLGNVPLLCSNDVAVGLMGVLTSADDLHILWRKRT